MKKRKNIDLLSVSDSEKTRLIWEIRRQMQQKVLEEKLARSLLSSHANIDYPEGISVAIEDLIRKAVEELKHREGVIRG